MHRVASLRPFRTSLTVCSSRSDRPDGTYVFLNSSTKGNLESACSEIANRLRTVGESIDQPEED